MFRLQQQVQTFSQAQVVRHIRHQRAQVLTVQLQALKPRQRLLTQNYSRLKNLDIMKRGYLSSLFCYLEILSIA